MEDKLTNSVPIRRGVRQGCIVSPTLFNMYSEKIFQNALEVIHEGIKVNGRFVNNIRYADDTVIIANSQEGLQNLINAITREGDAFGLKINTEKTKTMVISKNPKKSLLTNPTLSPNIRYRFVKAYIYSILL